MKYLLALSIMLYSQVATPEQTNLEWWQEGIMGAPCTLKLDFEDGVCVKVNLDEIDWRKK